MLPDKSGTKDIGIKELGSGQTLNFRCNHPKNLVGNVKIAGVEKMDETPLSRVNRLIHGIEDAAIRSADDPKARV